MFEKKINKEKLINKLKDEKRKCKNEENSWNRYYDCKLDNLIKWVGEN